MHVPLSPTVPCPLTPAFLITLAEGSRYAGLMISLWETAAKQVTCCSPAACCAFLSTGVLAEVLSLRILESLKTHSSIQNKSRGDCRASQPGTSTAATAGILLGSRAPLGKRLSLKAGTGAARTLLLA